MREALAREFSAGFHDPATTEIVVTLDHRLAADSGPAKVVRVGPGEEERVVREQARRTDLTLVIAPETAGLLETRVHWVEHEGLTSIGSRPSAIRATADKLETARIFARREIRTPPTRRFSKLEGLPRDFRYPAVLKPIDGAGSLDTWVVASADDWRVIDRYPHPSGVLQPWLGGEPMSAGFLVGASGKGRLVAAAKQRIVVDEGSVRYAGGCLVTSVESVDGHVRRAIEAVGGLRGFVGVDYLWDSETRRATVIEINPRPTTSLTAMLERLAPGTLAREWTRLLADDAVDGSSLPPLLQCDSEHEFGAGLAPALRGDDVDYE
jgi:predicted ATP-grasp superfamily ATP-dependent carboligase